MFRYRKYADFATEEFNVPCFIEMYKPNDNVIIYIGKFRTLNAKITTSLPEAYSPKTLCNVLLMLRFHKPLNRRVAVLRDITSMGW